jgi:L-fucose isomerase-like protein
MNVLFLPTARLTFDVELAEKIFNESKEMLMAMENIKPIIPEGLLTDPQMLIDFVKQSGLDADLILFQDTTFTDGEFIKGAVDLVDVPVIIWGIREPNVGGRLRLNSLTGVMSTANFLTNNKKSYLYTMGNPTEHELILNLKKQMNVISTIKKLKELNVGVVGDYPNGFFFSDANKQELKDTLGVDLKHYDLHKWFK